jgi:hypothetical protein
MKANIKCAATCEVLLATILPYSVVRLLLNKCRM